MFGIAALALAASLPVIDSIRIGSNWFGLGKSRAETYEIVRHGNHYERTATRIPQVAVDRFAAAIIAAPVERKTALRGLATREWLRARASEPHGDFISFCSPEAKRLFEEYFVDREKAVTALDRYFSGGRLDDYPFISIDVTFGNRQPMHLESHAQPALMLPWKVGNSETWNPEIPRAIAGLLPAGAEPRLSDRSLEEAYVQRVAFEVGDALYETEERCMHRKRRPKSH